MAQEANKELHEPQVTNRSSLGLLQVYTGEGKGKTTSALGQALRAIGHGLRVLVIQFMKGRPTGEIVASKQLEPYLTILQYGSPRFVFGRKPEEGEIELARSGLERAREALEKRECDMLVLDELNVALSAGLLELKQVLELLQNRPPGIEIVVTGRNAPPELVELADLVSEVRLVKHPFQKSIPARKGTEF